MHTRTSKKGQALIIIVLAIIGLLGLTALAIDGGNAFADRSRAQSAADNAAFAAALALVQDEDYQAAGLSMAATNGYTNDGVFSTVAVSNDPMGAGCNGSVPTITLKDANDRLEYYLLVVIHSNVDTFFGPVIGVNQTHNCVQSIVRAKPGIYTALAYGNAVAALNCTSRWAIDQGGSSDVILYDGGLFSNSTDPAAMRILQPDQLIAPSFSAVGGITPEDVTLEDEFGNVISPVTGLPQLPCPEELPDYMIPQYSCDADHTYSDFPPDKRDDEADDNVSIREETIIVDGKEKNEDVAYIQPGTYCIDGVFKEMNMEGIGVTFILTGDRRLNWSGGKAQIHLEAPTSGTTKGLLMYFLTDTYITLNGNANTDLVGSIFAPFATIKITGSFGGVASESQWIGNTIDMTGNPQIIIQYDDTKVYQYPAPPEIELVR